MSVNLNLMNAFHAGLIAAGDIPMDRAVGVAVSGGGDSMALLHLLCDYQGISKSQIHVATIDHGLRSESAKEVSFVRDICLKLGVSCHRLLWRGWDNIGNLQDAARRGRQQILSDWAQEQELSTIILGHTADDQAETLLMRLARGSGVDGLAAMAPCQMIGDLYFLRPLLDITRAELRVYLRRINGSWIEDPSNEDMRFDRVRLRKAQALLDELGLDIKTLTTTSRHMRRARQALEQMTWQAAKHCVTINAAGSVLVDIVALMDYPDEVQYRLLSYALVWLSGQEYRPRFQSLITFVEKMRSGGKHTLLGCYGTSKGRYIELCREASAMPEVMVDDVYAISLYDNRWKITPPSGYKAPFVIAALGGAGLTHCKGWRDLGLSYAALIASPAIWQNNHLISAPIAGLKNGWSCEIDSHNHNFFINILSD